MAHTYTATFAIHASPEGVYRYLTTPAMQNVYLPDSTVALVSDLDIVVGSTWKEARKSLLFLRDWSEVSFRLRRWVMLCLHS